jgi:hypothetical protein
MPRRRGVGSITRRRADAALTGIKHMLQLRNGVFLVKSGEQVLADLTAIRVVSIAVNAFFGFFFSHVVTAQLISRLSASMFAHGMSGVVEYKEKNEDGTVVRLVSNLSALDIWSTRVREVQKLHFTDLM